MTFVHTEPVKDARLIVTIKGIVFTSAAMPKKRAQKMAKKLYADKAISEWHVDKVAPDKPAADHEPEE